MNNCLIIIKNKKILNVPENVQSFLELCAKSNYYFDKCTSVSFNNAGEITCQLSQCASGYDNCVIICPSQTLSSVKGYLSNLFKASFNEKNCLHSEGKSIYVALDNETDFSYIIQSLDNKYGIKFGKLYLKCIGAPVELIDEAIACVTKKYCDLTFFVSNKYDEQIIEITYKDDTSKMIVDDVLRILVSFLNSYVYAMEDVSLAERVYQLLKLRRMTLSVAESFTGGGISYKLVEIPGVSQVFFEGVNTYSNLSKIQRLGVNDMAIKQKGAVSDEVACQMAQGLIESGNCDVAISTTGIAGPSSDGSSKPVGLCYIAIAVKEGVSVYKFNFVGDRKHITNTAINHALFLAYKMIK